MRFAKNPFPYGTTVEEVLGHNADKIKEQEDRWTAFAARYPILRKWQAEMKELGYAEEILQKGDASVVAAIQAELVDYTQPKLVGRQVSSPTPVPNVSTSFTFYRDRPATSYAFAGAGTAVVATGIPDTQTISLDPEIESKAEWTRTYVEDVPFAVALRQARNVGRAVSRDETNKVVDAIEATTLPTGHSIALSADIWNDIADAVAGIEADSGEANFALWHSGDVNRLWKNDKFIHQFYFGDDFDARTGVLGQSYLGLTFVRTAVASKDITTAEIGSSEMVPLIIKRDLLTEPYENPASASFGYRASMRVGAGVLLRYNEPGQATAPTADEWDFGRITGL